MFTINGSQSKEECIKRSVEARVLLTQLNLTFIGLFAAFSKILADVMLLSDMLQLSSLDLARTVDLIQGLLRGILG